MMPPHATGIDTGSAAGVDELRGVYATVHSSPPMRTPKVAAARGSSKVTSTSLVRATPAPSPSFFSSWLGLGLGLGSGSGSGLGLGLGLGLFRTACCSARPDASYAAGPRSAASSSMGYCCSARAAALKVTSRGNVCALCGGTVAHPQLMRRVPPALAG